MHPYLKTPYSEPPIRPDDLTIDIKFGNVLEGHAGEMTVRKDQRIQFNESTLRSHVAIFGGTRMGKSKLLEMMMRDLTAGYTAGYCLIDPHGDLCDEMLGYVGLHWHEIPEWKKANLYYLNPSEQPFCFDPFQYYEPDDTGGLSPEAYYRNWLEAAVDRTAEIVLRQQGEYTFKGMSRLEKYLKAVLYATGVRIDRDGTHLPLAYAPVLIDPGHDMYDEVFGLISPHLPIQHRRTLQRIASFPEERMEDYVGSTENRLTTMLRPIVKDTFSGQAAPLDLKRAVRQNGILLCNLADTEVFTKRPADAIGGLLISQLINIARSTPRDQRQPFYLVIDEAHRFVGYDILDTLGQSSKWGLFFVIAVQGLDRLRSEKEDVDLLPQVLTNCNVKMTFRMQNIDDAERLAKNLCYRDLDFTKLIHKQQFHGEYLWVDTESTTEGTNWEEGRTWADTEMWSHTDSQSVTDGTTTTDTDAVTWNKGSSDAVADGITEQEQTSAAHTEGEADADTEGDSHVDIKSEGAAHARGVGRSESEFTSSGMGFGDTMPPVTVGREIVYTPGTTDTTHSGRGSGKADSEFESQVRMASKGSANGTHKSKTQTKNQQDTLGIADTKGTNQTKTSTEQRSKGGSRAHSEAVIHTVTIGRSDTYGGSRMEGGSESKGGSSSVTRQKVPLAQFYIEDVDTGQLESSVDVQLARKTQLINTLRRAQVLVATTDAETTIAAQICYVHDAYDGLPESWKPLQIAHVKTTIYTRHSCYLDGTLSMADPAHEERVLRQWIENPSLPGVEIELALDQTPADYEPAYSPPGFPSDF